MADLHLPVVVLTAGFPRLSMDPSSVMGDVHFESTVIGSISLFSEFSEPTQFCRLLHQLFRK